jgi:hypothetical protein
MKHTHPARPLEADYPPLMLCQVDALRFYAAAHGDRWKDDLRLDWLALQLHFRFKMCLLCYGLMSSSPQ